MVEKRLDAKWSGIQMPFENGIARPFEYRTNGWYNQKYVTCNEYYLVYKRMLDPIIISYKLTTCC